MKKSKRLAAIALSLVTVVASAVSMMACDDDLRRGSDGEVQDNSKTQLYVKNYQGGFGNKWLYNAKKKFEEIYKDEELETGKKGVQVLITEQKATPTYSEVSSDYFELYFSEDASYRTLVSQGAVADITDVITQPNKYDVIDETTGTNKTIASKMSDAQKNFYDMEGCYYAIPHYVSTPGLIYNIDLFRERGYYFKQGYENETSRDAKFIRPDSFDDNGNLRSDTVLSAGPDAQPGTYDDGLPATYADFWDLCEAITDDGNQALNWGSASSEFSYTTGFMIHLIGNNQGAEQFATNYTFEGVVKDPVIISGGKAQLNGDGTPQIGAPITLEPDKDNGENTIDGNGYETFKSASVYYAMEFMGNWGKNYEKYSGGRYTNANNTGYTAFNAQRDYLISRLGTSKAGVQAILLDGTWWDCESSDDFKALADNGVSKEECNYGWLPLPKATSDTVGQKGVIVNGVNFGYIKAGLSTMKENLAKDFLRLLNTDEAYADFTACTNSFKDFKYELTEAQLNSLSSFGRSLYNDFQAKDVVNPIDNNDQFLSTVYTTQAFRRYSSKNGAYVMAECKPKVGGNVATYFAQTYNYNKKTYWRIGA